ncbi:MAG: hypothetical protein IRZ16_22840, partial [Myxococcaceae bacterium]|nr:hypothetical protein [Myxococcaceae bacterium]
MPRFEVFIPAADENGFNVTFRVDADNWMAALKTGMTKLGEQGANVRNILVDIQDDNSVHVTESASGRVFRIRELTDSEAAQAQVKKGAAPSRATMPAAPPAPEPAQAPKPLPEHKTLVGLPSFAEPPPAPPAPPSDAARETLPGRPPDLEVTPEPPPARGRINISPPPRRRD